MCDDEMFTEEHVILGRVETVAAAGDLRWLTTNSTVSSHCADVHTAELGIQSSASCSSSLGQLCSALTGSTVQRALWVYSALLRRTSILQIVEGAAPMVAT